MKANLRSLQSLADDNLPEEIKLYPRLQRGLTHLNRMAFVSGVSAPMCTRQRPTENLLY